MPRAFRMPAAAAIAVFLAMCCAAPAQGARQRGYEGSLLIVHRGTVVGAPELGYTASGKFSYSGRYRLSGRRIQKPETSTVKPSTGAWFDLVGSGKNSLDMTFDWAHRDQGRTETVYRRWKGGGDISLTPRPNMAGETRPLRLQTRQGWFYLDLSRLGPVQQPLTPGFPVDVYARRVEEESCDPEPGVSRQQTTFTNGLYKDELLAACPDQEVDVPFPHLRGKTEPQTIWPADVWDPSTSGGEIPPAMCRPPNGVRMTGLPARTLCGKRRKGRFSGTITLPGPSQGYPWSGDCPFSTWAPGGIEDTYSLTCPQGLDDPFPAWNGDFVGSRRQTVVTWSFRPLR